MSLNRAWPARSATVALFLVNGVGIGTWAAAIVNLKSKLELSDGQLSLMLLSLAIGAIPAMPLAGWIGSRVSTARASSVAGLVFSVSLVTPPFATTLAVLCLAAGILGASSGAMDVLMNAHASSIERRWSSPIMSSFHAAFSIGGMAGALLGAKLAAAGAAAQLSAASSLCVVTTLAASAFLGPGEHAVAKVMMFKLPDRSLIALGVIALLCLMIEGAVSDWSGALMTQSGVSVSVAALGYVAFSLCMVIGRLSGDWVIAKFGRIAILRSGGAVAATGLGLIVFVQGAPADTVGFGLVGLGMSNIVPAVFSAAARSGASAASGVAATATAGYAGLVLGPLVIGAVATVSDLRCGMAVLAAAAIAISIVAGTKTPS